TQFRDGDGSLGRAAGLAALLGAGFAAGSAGLAVVERRMRPARVDAPPLVGGPPIGGGATDAMTVEQAEALALESHQAQVRALRTGMTIAVAIGLHNFAEGLAIGVSASAGEI